MTLVRKVLFKVMAVLGGFALLGVASIWALSGLREDNQIAVQEFDELRDMELIGVRVAAAKAMVLEGNSNEALAASLRGAVNDLQAFNASQDTEVDEDEPAEAAHEQREKKYSKLAIDELQAAIAELQHPDSRKTASGSVDTRPMTARLDRAVADIGSVCKEAATFVKTAHRSGQKRLRSALWVMTGLSVATFTGAILIALSLSRSIVIPLTRLHGGVREIAAGHFSQRLEVSGDREFAELAQDFNRMAAELEEFYHKLEQKVAAKSKELVRSERLASVGYLAAGIAHEIRNPLGIISGYAELSLKRLGESEPLRRATRDGNALRVIRDEAFRCKRITERLLGLVQGGDDAREIVPLAQLTREVLFLVRGLHTHRERASAVQVRIPEALCVSANVIEMKQVLLNLTLNALEAIQPGSGEIRIEGREEGGWIELSVRDNGCGMSPDTLDRVFEPLFTGKRGTVGPGTGLGLSITHAIVESHGGRIGAESDGPGQGSRFVIRLPSMPVVAA